MTARDLKGDDLNHNTAARSHMTSAEEMVITHTEIATAFHPSPTQYEPDSTDVEYTPIGPPIPLNEFSTPYEHSLMPDGQCGICHESLIGLESQTLVYA